MTSTIKVDNIQDQDGNNIINENANTITIGASGDTVTLASGASATGFSRTGTVDWQTSIKTSGFTAVSGEGYFCNTTSASFTVTLPASPSVGDIVALKDYANTFDTNNLIIGRNSSNIGGEAEDSILDQEGLAITFVYADATKGWLVTESGLQSEAPGAEYVAATGGTIVTCGNFKYHTFTGPGTFTVSNAGNSGGSNKLQYLVVAGGGSGAGDNTGCGRHGSGGGAGGYRFSETGLCAVAQAYPITVGAGGSGGTSPGSDGSNSVFSTITSAGGGGGGNGDAAPKAGRPGGSGGGAGRNICSSCVGAGNTPPVSPPQGNPGGASFPSSPNPVTNGGGGGAGAAAATVSGATAAPGGIGKNNLSAWATATSTGDSGYYAGGGGGGAHGVPGGTSFQGLGGSGGGGNGAISTANGSGSAGTANTGGGGGGATTLGGGSGGNGGAGGSGIVIIKYQFQGS